MFGFISGLYSVPLLYVLSMCQYHTVLITVTLQQVLKFGSESHPTLSGLFRIVLSILAQLDFHINFRNSLLISAKISAGILTKIVLNLQINWGKCTILKNIIFCSIPMNQLSIYIDLLKISLRHLFLHPFAFDPQHPQHCRAPLMGQVLC